MEQKVKENRARRAASRQGLSLMKSRSRDPRAIGYGGYLLLDSYTSVPQVGDPSVAGGWLTLDDVEQALSQGGRA
jgi:hypothetical protein